MRHKKQQAWKGPGHLLTTNSIQKDPRAQDTWQTTCRNVSLSFRWFQDSVIRHWPAARKIKMCKAHSFLLAFTLPLILNTPGKT